MYEHENPEAHSRTPYDQMFHQFLVNSIKIEDPILKSTVVNFWKQFYSLPVHVEDEKKSTNRTLYKQRVIEELNEFKKTHEQPYSYEDLYALQERIELLTIMFDEESIHVTCSHIMKEMISSNKENAKDFVLDRLTSEQDKSHLKWMM